MENEWAISPKVPQNVKQGLTLNHYLHAFPFFQVFLVFPVCLYGSLGKKKCVRTY